MTQEVELSTLMGSPGCYRRWQQLSLIGDAQLQQLQRHCVSHHGHDHRQTPFPLQSLPSHAKPSLAGTDWTLDTQDTLDTEASAQTAVAAKTGALVICIALCSGCGTCGQKKLEGNASIWAIAQYVCK